MCFWKTFFEVSPSWSFSSEATKSYSNYFKRLQKKEMCSALFRVVFCQKKIPQKIFSFFRKCPFSTYLTTLKWRKKNWVSFNKNLRLHFVKKNPTFSNREIQCEKSDTCHCHTLYYYHIFFCLSKKNLFVRKNWKLLGKNLKQRKQRNEKNRIILFVWN